MRRRAKPTNPKAVRPWCGVRAAERADEALARSETVPRAPVRAALWSLDLDRELGEIERDERQILAQLHLPGATDPARSATDLAATIYAILAGEQPPPWPSKMKHAAARARAAQRLERALAHLRRLAGDAPLLVTLGARVQAKNRDAARQRGHDLAAAARALDAEIRRRAEDYRRRHPHASSRSLAANVARQLGCSPHTIRRRLRALGLR
jgi:hypothetical protein